ncbi:MAG: sulfatase-like hydrolase/transferase [Planctomycetota bacterium]
MMYPSRHDRGIIALLLAFFMGADTGHIDAAETAPNFIVIVADDLGYNDLSCMGQTRFQTPHLDARAQQGMRFTQFYAGCTVCGPSRACLLTGQHTGHVFQRFNGQIQFREDPLDITIASRLKSQGYRTAMIGKSGLSCNSNDGNLPSRKGFDYFMGFTSHGAAHRYYPRQLWRDGILASYPDNQGKEGSVYTGDLFLEASLNWIDENQEAPFFLHLALQQPHADLQVPDAYRNKYIGRCEESPAPGGHYRAETHPKATFVGMIDYLDQSVGKIIQKLRDLKIDSNTVVFFTSDNGPHFEGGHSPEALDSNGIYRGGKRDLYEGGIRVPMIAWWPGHIPAEQTSSIASAFWDLPATMCDLAGLDIPESFDGISLVPTLLAKGSQSQHDYLYWEFYERGGKQAIRMGRWKGIRLEVSNDPNGPLEVYDLENDPSETQDLAGSHPEVAEQLNDWIKRAHTPSEAISFASGARAKQRTQGKRVENVDWLERQHWKVVEASSESKSNGRTVDKIIDGDAMTHWHTNFTGETPSHPHWFVIDLGESFALHSAGFLCRQDGSRNGMIGEVEIQISDTLTFASEGQRFQLTGSIHEQRVELSGTGRYIKVIAHSELSGQKYASLSEFNLEAKKLPGLNDT